MAYYLKLYAATFAAFFAIDLVWLGLIAPAFYRKHIGFLLAPQVNWGAALLFYVLFMLGILVFVVVPGLQAGSLKLTMLRGALFGLITYATYDLTNHATVKDWPMIVTVVDLIWGTVLCCLVSGAAFMAGKWLR